MTDGAAEGDTEGARIAVLQRLFGSEARAEVGIGDDAAVVPHDGRPGVYSVDAAVEGVHFERSWLAPEDIAYRAFMAAASDLAAMGALPSHALCAWTLPADLDDASVEALGVGTQRAAEATGLVVVGGNLTGGARLSLTTTVVGLLDGAAVLRSGGHSGNSLFVTGPLGAPRIGLALLQRGDANRQDPFVRAFAAPRARLDLAPALREAASCALDLSDGLLPDLRRLCAASGLGAHIDVPRLPRLASHDDRARQLGLDPDDCLLSGGEEYELLFAAEATDLPWATRIGQLLPQDEGIRLVGADGAPRALPAGFRHF